ncbi:MAG: hypothetical protein RLZZ308_318 [Candidatus Parcubacteria bacterium]|jgi:hypothetical protein
MERLIVRSEHDTYAPKITPITLALEPNSSLLFVTVLSTDVMLWGF